MVSDETRQNERYPLLNKQRFSPNITSNLMSEVLQIHKRSVKDCLEAFFYYFLVIRLRSFRILEFLSRFMGLFGNLSQDIQSFMTKLFIFSFKGYQRHMELSVTFSRAFSGLLRIHQKCFLFFFFFFFIQGILLNSLRSFRILSDSDCVLLLNKLKRTVSASEV